MKDAPLKFKWIQSALPNFFKKKDIERLNSAIEQARKSGIDWSVIIGVLLPLIISLFYGGNINIQSIIDAILALFNN